MKGAELAVDIGDGHGVAVHKGQLAYPGAGQTFGSVAAHTAQSEQNDMAPGQPLLGLPAPQHLVAEKTLVHRGTSSSEKSRF